MTSSASCSKHQASKQPPSPHPLPMEIRPLVCYLSILVVLALATVKLGHPQLLPHCLTHHSVEVSNPFYVISPSGHTYPHQPAETALPGFTPQVLSSASLAACLPPSGFSSTSYGGTCDWRTIQS